MQMNCGEASPLTAKGLFTTTVWQDTVNKLRGKVKDAVKNKEKEKQLLIENIKSIKKQLKVGKYDIVYNKKCTHCRVADPVPNVRIILSDPTFFSTDPHQIILDTEAHFCTV